MVWSPHHHRLLGPASPPVVATTSRDNNEPRVTKDTNNIDSNMVVILGVLLFALLCALGLNSVVRCILRCTTRHHHHHNRREVGPRGGAAFMGAATRGLKRSTIRQIPITTYHVATTTTSGKNNNNNNNNNVMSTDCMICLGEFVEGEKIKVLPKCKHGFHSKCIDAWLLSHSTCPTCRQSLLEWAGSSSSSSSGAIVVPMRSHDETSGGDATQRD